MRLWHAHLLRQGSWKNMQILIQMKEKLFFNFFFSLCRRGVISGSIKQLIKNDTLKVKEGRKSV